jgi:hypothetical protein
MAYLPWSFRKFLNESGMNFILGNMFSSCLHVVQFNINWYSQENKILPPNINTSFHHPLTPIELFQRQCTYSRSLKPPKKYLEHNPTIVHLCYILLETCIETYQDSVVYRCYLFKSYSRERCGTFFLGFVCSNMERPPRSNKTT